MGFISNFLIHLSNATIPLGWLAIIIGFACGLLRGAGKYLKMRNNEELKVIEPEAKAIMAKYANDEKTKDEKLSALYKEHHFSVLPPLIFNILGALVFILVLSSVINIKSFDVTAYTNAKNFFSIANIFERQTLIIMPIITFIVTTISSYIFIPKELINIKTILINSLVSIAAIFLISNILVPIYSLFIFGSSFGIMLLSFKANKMKRDLYYKYPNVPQEPQKPQKQKSFSEIYNDVDKQLDSIIKPKNVKNKKKK